MKRLLLIPILLIGCGPTVPEACSYGHYEDSKTFTPIPIVIGEGGQPICVLPAGEVEFVCDCFGDECGDLPEGSVYPDEVTLISGEI